MSISFTYCGVACGVISIDDKFYIGIDPDLSPKGTKVQFKGFVSEKQNDVYNDTTLLNKVNIWLITHNHQYHLDDIGRNYMREKIVISPNEKIIKDLLCSNSIILNWNDEKKFTIDEYQITIKAIPAYHASNFIMQVIIGKVNGYQISIIGPSETKVLYFTSDTIFYPKLINYISRNIDAVFANLGAVKTGSFGGPFTMNLKMLRQLNDLLHPKIIYPIHIDDYSHYQTTKKEVTDAGYKVLTIGERIDI